jgi:predicted phosphodiesterase
MKLFRNVLIAIILICTCAMASAQENYFYVKPYLQVGSQPGPDKMNILWQTSVDSSEWKLEYRSSNASSWKSIQPFESFLRISNNYQRKLLQANINGLIPGSVFDYRVLRNGSIVFKSSAHALKSKEQSYRIVAMGDIGAGTKEAKGIAFQAYKNKPDLIVVPGDIVYERGLISEYNNNFWGVYNKETPDSMGAPLMRSIPFLASVGNHDTEVRDFITYPDALGYFQFWDQPLNGPSLKEGGASFPMLTITDSARKKFISVAKERFPAMSNFSFDYGNAHWLILDSNPYVDWTNKELTDWVETDLNLAKDATWKFVLYHHPGINSSREHFEQQHMRLLSPIFEKGNVDVVFNGHVHNYQRSYPMTFSPDKKGTLLIGGKDNKTIRGRVVNGQWKLDKSFNGTSLTHPKGVIYVVTGAGGQELYNPEQETDVDSWQKFTHKFISTVHSLSVIDINGKKLHIKQISIDGKEVDQFTITK